MYKETDFSTVTYPSPTHPLAVLAPLPKEPRYYTLAEFLRKVDRTEGFYEYYDGIISKLPMARGPHNTITANIVTALNMAFMAENLDYIVMTAQQQVYLPELNFSLMPDALVVTDTPQYFDNNQVLLTNPILIVEVLSKSTKTYDQTDKFEEYCTLESFKEYVLINPNKRQIQVRYRTDVHTWAVTNYIEEDASILLKSIQCTIQSKMVYRNISFPEKKKPR